MGSAESAAAQLADDLDTADADTARAHHVTGARYLVSGDQAQRYEYDRGICFFSTFHVVSHGLAYLLGLLRGDPLAIDYEF